MRRIIEISPGTDRAILELIDEGRYSSYQDFVSVAVDNQLLLEHGSEGETVSPGLVRDWKSAPEAWARTSRDQDRRRRVDPASLETVEELPGRRLVGGDKQSRWLWGQINSVLAIKFACREIGQLLSTGTSYALAELGSAVGAGAALVGTQLRAADRSRQASRGENLATSFPKPTEKSLSRFANQYVGVLRRNGQFDGALFQLGLLGAAEDGAPRLTSRGAELGFLRNPNLDSDGEPRDRWLSEEEERFYIHNVMAHAIPERIPATWALDVTGGRGATRQDMLADLRKRCPEWSDAEVETYRVGTVSRLAQVRVLSVLRNGRKVHYRLGPNAQVAVEALGLRR